MKYNNVKQTIDGIVFDSKLEADLYQTLKLLKAAGKIESIECHVPYDLHGADGETKVCTYKVDFRIGCFSKSQHIMAGSTSKHLLHRCIEAKGVWTSTAELKQKLFEAEYGTLEIHTKDVPFKL